MHICRHLQQLRPIPAFVRQELLPRKSSSFLLPEHLRKQWWLSTRSERITNRKRYQITPDGVCVIDQWVRDPQAPGVFSTSTLFARVSIALLSGRDADAVLEDQRTSHLARMRDLTRARTEADPHTEMALTYELAHLDADLTWIQECITRLDLLRADLGGAR